MQTRGCIELRFKSILLLWNNFLYVFNTKSIIINLISCKILFKIWKFLRESKSIANSSENQAIHI